LLASGDQMIGDLGSAISRILLAKQVFDIHCATFARIQRTDAFVDFATESVQVFDMGQQLPTNFFLVGFRQAG